MSQLRINTVFSADGTGLFNTIGKAKAAVASVRGMMANSLKGQVAAYFGIGAIAMFARKTMEYADNLDEAASMVGVNVEKLQEWEYAAKQTGARLEDLVGFMEKLNKFAQTDKGAQRLRAFGIDPSQNMGGLMESLWKKAPGMGPSQLSPLLMDLGGRGSYKMFNTLQMDINSLSEEARKFGQVMNKETVQALGRLNDQFGLLSKILMTQFGPAILTATKYLITGFGQVKGSVGYWKTATKDMNWKDLMKMAFMGLSDESIQNWVKLVKNIQTGAPQSTYNAIIDEIDGVIAGLLNYKVPPPDQGGKDLPGEGKRAIRTESDSLTKVGNFLGAGGPILASISEQQLTVARQHHETAKKQIVKTDELIAALVRSGIGVPP